MRLRGWSPPRQALAVDPPAGAGVTTAHRCRAAPAGTALSHLSKTPTGRGGEIAAMKTPLRYIAWAAASLLLCAGIAAAVLYINSERRLHRVVDVAVAPVPYAAGPAAEEHGKYLYLSRCSECHAEDGAGRSFVKEANGLHLAGSNLTLGRGSAVSQYTERDWVRAIRHGVKPDGRPTFVMPSEDFNRLSDADLADVVAHIRSLAPKDGPGAIIQLPLLVKLAHGAGLVKDAAEKIDHSQPPAAAVPAGATAEYGRYVAQFCIGCHGAQFMGGPIAGAPPGWPPAAQLAGPGSALARYASADQFKTLLRTRVRPDGSTANAAMPTNKHLSDTDLEAMFLFFRSTQPAPKAPLAPGDR